MNKVETILFKQLQRHATHYVESKERGIVVDDLDVDSFIEETSKLLQTNGEDLKQGSDEVCNCTHTQACRICGEEKGLDGDFWNKLQTKA